MSSRIVRVEERRLTADSYARAYRQLNKHRSVRVVPRLVRALGADLEVFVVVDVGAKS